jgi:multiple sugar transport system substrate-binding protein
MRDAAGLMVPTRSSLLNDQELIAKYRFFPAAKAALSVGEGSPRLPEFYSVGQFITKRIGQSLIGEMQVKPALDMAAKETEDFLKGHGYYQ